MFARGWWTVGLAFLLSGCVGSSGNEQVLPAEDLNAGSGLDLKPILDVSPQARTLAEPPQWRMGEWWTYRLMDYFTGREIDVQRIVVGIENDNYLVGMPKEHWRNSAMVLHIPGFGEVRKNDLSFEVHDARFEPVKFPLAKDKTWETAFEGHKVTATVTGIEGNRATIHFVGPADDITLTYDADLGEVAAYDGVGYAKYEIVDHGVGFEGLVTVPHMHDLIFLELRFAGVLAPDGTQIPEAVPFFGGGYVDASNQDTVEVGTTYDRVSFVIILGSLPLAPEVPPAPNTYYSEKVTAPDGTVYENSIMAPDGDDFRFWFYQHDKPGGTWTFEHVAAGPGIALTEGIAYHVYDVDMPSGRVLPSTGEHPHGDG